MKGFEPLLFLCVALYLAEGHYYYRPRVQDQHHEYAPHVYRRDWDPLREEVILRLRRDMGDESKGSLRSFQKPVWEGPVLLPVGDIESSDEDRRPSVVSAAGFRHSPAISGLGATFHHPVNIFPDYRLIISSRSSPTEDCFVRRVIALMNLMVANSYEKAIDVYGDKATSSQLLHVMLRELRDNLESVHKIEDLDRELLKHVKVFRIFFRLLRKTFVEHSGETPEMSLALAFFSQVELILQDFLDIAAEDSRDIAPGIRLLLDALDSILTDLNEEKEAPWKKYITHLPEIQRFADDARAVLDALIKGFFSLKRSSEVKVFALREILVNIDSALREVISDYSLYDDRTPGTADNFLHRFLSEIQRKLSGFLERTSF